jgi:hypothetical protein
VPFILFYLLFLAGCGPIVVISSFLVNKDKIYHDKYIQVNNILISIPCVLIHKSECISGYKSQKVVGEKLRQAHLFVLIKTTFH